MPGSTPTPRAVGPDGAAAPPPEPSELDEASLALLSAFRQALRAHRRFMARATSEADLHPGQAMCLSVIARDEGMPQRDLADALHIAPPTLSRMLGSLEKTGLIERCADEADQRLTRVYLTSSGRGVAQKMRRALAAHLPAAMSALSLDERRELARLLDKLNGSIAATLQPADDSTPEAGP